MARDDETDQLEQLALRGRRVSFFRALLTLEALLPEGVPIGYKGPPAKERVRIRPSPSLACPPADLDRVEVDHEQQRATVITTFLGLYGVDSPLPSSYVEHLARIANSGAGERVCAFLDVFHHRLYALLFRAWKRARPVSVEEPTDPSCRALSVTGFDRQLGIGGSVLPRLADARLRALRPRTAEGLEASLRARLGVRCQVIPLQPRVVELPADQHSLLGRQGCTLGGTVVGARIRDRHRITIRLGASSLKQWHRLARGGDLNRQIDQTVRSYLRDPIDYEVEVRMDAEHARPCQLGSRETPLGTSAWLGWPSPEARWKWAGARRKAPPPLGVGQRPKTA